MNKEKLNINNEPQTTEPSKQFGFEAIVSKPFILTDRLIRLSHLKRILTDLEKWDERIEKRLKYFMETGL